MVTPVKFGIFRKFLLVTIASVFTLAVFMLALTISTQNYLMQQQLDERVGFIKLNLEDKALVLGQSMSHQLEQSLSTYSFFDIYTVLNEELRLNPDLNYAHLIDKNGKVYFNNLPRSVTINTEIEIPEEMDVSEVAILNSRYLEYTFPLKISIDYWGVLKLGFSLLPVDNAISTLRYEYAIQNRRIIFSTLFVSFIIVIISILITGYLSRRITSPIIELSEHVQEFSEDMTSFKSTIGAAEQNDEVGVLSKSFVEMADRIIESRKKLEEYSKTLEDQVIDRTKELKEINEELNNFAYVVSHDLKSPLNSIKTLAEWLYKDHSNDFSDDAQEQLSLLLGSVEQMKLLIDGILNYSRMGYKGEAKESISLTELLDNVTALLSPPPHISLLYSRDLPVLKIEKVRIQQVFLNIISNAIQYNDKVKGEIKISCKQDGDFWHVSISDNGPGISKENQCKIFQIFKSFSTNSISGNTGIGLSVVKKIIRMNGGKIWVDSELGKGTTFNFTLPVT